MKLLAIGEVMAEIRKGDGEEFSVGFAGDTYNTAVYCARELGSANNIGYMTRIGSDPLSNALKSRLNEEAIDASAVAIDCNRNIGIYSVSTDNSGERSFHYWRDRSAARNMFLSATDFDCLDQADIIYLSGITLAILAQKARVRLIDKLASLSQSGNTLIAFDSNYRPELWEDTITARHVTQSLWQIADIALPSIDDEMALFGETASEVVERFSSQDWQACAIKQGQAGPLAPSLIGRDHPTFLPADMVIDTTAAGDSFNAGYLASLIMGRDEVCCLESGHNLARRVVQSPGAILPIGAD